MTNEVPGQQVRACVIDDNDDDNPSINKSECFAMRLSIRNKASANISVDTTKQPLTSSAWCNGRGNSPSAVYQC
eukprot:scaffold172977_cov24-Prasinocladus_malaysianus.AAC.1